MFSEGIVQVYLNGQWGNICRDERIGWNEANTICYQLGYTGATSYGSAYNASLVLIVCTS